jgi:uncharacterized integral membrane protein
VGWRYQFYARFKRNKNHSGISGENIPEASSHVYRHLGKKEVKERGGRKVSWVKIFFGTVVILVVIVFLMQNKDEVILRFSLYPLWNHQWEVSQIPLFLVILCSILLGFIIGYMGDLYRHFQLKKTIRQNQKMIQRLEKEIQSLSSGPGLDETSFLEDEP